jgi:hypothetical protein
MPPTIETVQRKSLSARATRESLKNEDREHRRDKRHENEHAPNAESPSQPRRCADHRGRQHQSPIREPHMLMRERNNAKRSSPFGQRPTGRLAAVGRDKIHDCNVRVGRAMDSEPIPVGRGPMELRASMVRVDDESRWARPLEDNPVQAVITADPQRRDQQTRDERHDRSGPAQRLRHSCHGATTHLGLGVELRLCQHSR